MKILFVWPNRDRFGVKPLGISLLSAILKQRGHEVKLFDTSFMDLGGNNIDETLTAAGRFKPVDYGCDVSKKKVDYVEEFARTVDEWDPGVIGMSILSDEVSCALRMHKERPMRTYAWGNKGVGEVEERPGIGHRFHGESIVDFPTWVDGINALGPGPRLHTAYGWFKDLDSLPIPDWSIFDERHFLKPYEGKVYRGGDVMLGWGCVNSCTYCINESWRELHGGMQGSIRMYSVDAAIRQLRELKEKWGITLYKFHDENFLLKSRKWLEEFCVRYPKEVGVPFVCMVHPGSVMDWNSWLLAHAGCLSASMGVEAGDAVIRQILGRVDTPVEVVHAVSTLKVEGIRTSTFNMIGLPFDTPGTIDETIELNRIAAPDDVNVSFYMPLPGTRLARIAAEYGFYDPRANNDFRTDRPSLELPGINEELLMKYFRNFHRLVKED